MFALFYFDLGVYIDKIAIEMKNSSKNKLKKPPFNSQTKKSIQHPPSQLVLEYLQVLLSADMNS